MPERDVGDSIRRHPTSLGAPERHRRFGPWGIFAVVVSAAGIATGVILALAIGRGSDPAPLTGPPVGSRAPEFRLRALDGSEEVRLSDFLGRVVVVSFEREGCEECRAAEAALDEAWHLYRDRG